MEKIIMIDNNNLMYVEFLNFKNIKTKWISLTKEFGISLNSSKKIIENYNKDEIGKEAIEKIKEHIEESISENILNNVAFANDTTDNKFKVLINL